MSRLLALYPESWRKRYGDEFLALLADRPPAFRDRLDIVRGAFDAHLNPQVAGPERVGDRAGLAALAGSALIVVAVVIAANGPVQYDDYGTYRDGGAALPVLVASMGLFALALFRVIDRLPRPQGRSRAVGLIALACGLLWSFAPWTFPLLGIFMVGVVVVAAGAHHAGLWPRWPALALAVLVALPLVFMLVQMLLPWYVIRQAGLQALYVLVLFVPLMGIWIIYGLGLLRGFTSPRSV